MIKEISESNGEIQLVVFDLASEHYGVDISDVREIMRMQTITRVPGAFSLVEGVINLRGKVLPVIDLRKRLDLTVSNHTKESRIVVIDMAAGEIGVIVDAVSEVLCIPRYSIEPPSSVITRANSDYLWGIAKLSDKLIILIDPDKAFAGTASDEIDYNSIVEGMISVAGKSAKATTGQGSANAESTRKQEPVAA
jgi:purine-binding chemotaxis protein CheW